MAGSLREVVAAARAPFQGRTALIAELIALRHQVAVLRRSGTRRPCFRVPDRLFWVLLSRWWSGWRESLIIMQPETVLRWRRQGFFSIWRYRSRGRWRGGRPRIAHEIRDLITRMAQDNFLWGAPRIHGELLKLGVSVSQATVSGYMPDSRWRRSQSWRTFIRNQAAGIGSSELVRGNGVSDPPGTNARSGRHTARLRIARLITSLFSNLHPRPAWPRAVSCQRRNSPASDWAVLVAYATATSSIMKREAGRHAANPAREGMPRTRAPPRRGVAITKDNGARPPMLSHSKMPILAGPQSW
jgi:hypothetical protein